MKLDELKKNFERGYLYPAEVRELFEQADALSAVVERQKHAIDCCEGRLMYIDKLQSNVIPSNSDVLEIIRALPETPATALRLHDAEVLERLQHRLSALADGFMVSARRAHWQEVIDTIKSDAARLRAGGEG